MKAPSGGPPHGTTLAFDYGIRRIGVAVGDRLHATASALTTLKTHKGIPDWVALDTIVAEWEPRTLVVGIPHHADGSESGMAAKARAFALSLETRYKVPVDMVDESFTSRTAEAELRQQRRSGLLRRRLRRGDSDRIAARLILEAWMAQNDGSTTTEQET